MSNLVKWPEREDYGRFHKWIETPAELRYERARAEAAIARLRNLQKATIRFMASDIAKRHADYGCVDCLAEALSVIGSVP